MFLLNLVPLNTFVHLRIVVGISSSFFYYYAIYANQTLVSKGTSLRLPTTKVMDNHYIGSNTCSFNGIITSFMIIKDAGMPQAGCNVPTDDFCIGLTNFSLHSTISPTCLNGSILDPNLNICKSNSNSLWNHNT